MVTPSVPVFSFDTIAPRSWVAATLLNVAISSVAVLQPRLRKEPAVLLTLICYPWGLCLVYGLIGPPIGQDWEIASAVFFNQLGVVLGVLTAAELAWRAVGPGVARAVMRGMAASVIAWVIVQNLELQMGWPRWAQNFYWLGARLGRTFTWSSGRRRTCHTEPRCSPPNQDHRLLRIYMLDQLGIVSREMPLRPPQFILMRGDLANVAKPWVASGPYPIVACTTSRPKVSGTCRG